MARHTIAPIPEGYAVIPVRGQWYPMALRWDVPPVLHARSFLRTSTRRPISYAKRSLAVNFLTSYVSGRVPWASIDGDTKQALTREQFLESVVDNEEYAAYLEHVATPKASDY